MFWEASADEPDHGCAAAAVVGVHAEAHHTWSCVVFLQAEGPLTPRTANNVEVHLCNRRRGVGSHAL